MKKIFVSVGLAAAGVAGWSSASAQSLEAGATPKLWNVSASLRGFYDDNYAVAQNKKGSFGFEFTPSVSANVDLPQTDIGVKYTLGLYYYLQRANVGLNPLDVTHQGDLWVDHAFNERWKLNLADSLAVGQDPQLVQGGAVVRVAGNNLANRAQATLNTEWTKPFSTATHYGNNLFIYQNNNNSPTNGANPSNAALLNRIEQNAGIDLVTITVGCATAAMLKLPFRITRRRCHGSIISVIIATTIRITAMWAYLMNSAQA
jgi:hypothetical protein